MLNTVIVFISIAILSKVHADVIFTSERCDRVQYGLRPVHGDPTRYKQCGPSGRVWIVPCAPNMSFNPEDRVCKENVESSIVPTTTSTTTKLSTEIAEEFVFSTIRPKKPRIKSKTKSAKIKTRKPIKTTTPPIIVFNSKKNVTSLPAFPRPGRPRSTKKVMPVTHPTTFSPILTTTSTESTTTRAARPIVPSTTPFTTMKPEYTVKYNGKSMTESEFLDQLMHIVQHQKAVADRLQRQKFEQMEKERLRQEEEMKRKEAERLRQLEQAELERRAEQQRQAELFAEQERLEMEREREMLRIEKQKKLELARIRALEKLQKQRQLEKARIKQEMEAKRELEKKERIKQKMMELERQKEMSRRIAEQQKIAEEAQRREELRIKMEREKAEREASMKAEQKRRELEEERRRQFQLEQIRQIEEERRREQRMEQEREMLRQIAEAQRNSYTTPAPGMDEIERGIIRFTTTPSSDNSWNMKQLWMGNEIQQNEYGHDVCEIGGDCLLKYDYDSFCQHPRNPSFYLQCAPMFGRRGRWTERQCPDTLVFVVSLGRCEKDDSINNLSEYNTIEKVTEASARVPYDPDNRVIIPRLPSETSFVQWKGNRVIDHSVPTTRVYPPVPEPDDSHIYNTIDEFPKDLLPKMPEVIPRFPESDQRAEMYKNQNQIHGSVISKSSESLQFPPPTIRNQLSVDESDLSNIHPLFPRVQPDFLTRMVPTIDFKLHDNEPKSIGKIVKPVIKKVALNQTEKFLDQLLSDQVENNNGTSVHDDRLKIVANNEIEK